MDRDTRIDLMRLVHDELPPDVAQQLRQRIAADPELGRELDMLERQWRGLEQPDPPSAPPGFSTRVLARAQDSNGIGLAPAWWSHTLAGKAATAVLLAGGIAFGVVLASPSEAEDWGGYLEAEPTLAESYLLIMEEPTAEAAQENGS